MRRITKFALVSGIALSLVALGWAWWTTPRRNGDLYFYTVANGGYSVALSADALFGVDALQAFFIETQDKAWMDTLSHRMF
jgi:hypothetical protein